MKKTNRKSGFTLVELMIVAAIIAILAAIIIPLLASNRERAKIAEAQNLLGTAATAMKAYYAEHSAFPPDFTADNVGQVTADELGRGIYFTAPGYVGSTPTALSAWALSTTARAAAGTALSGKTVTLDQAGTWGGTAKSDKVVNY